MLSIIKERLRKLRLLHLCEYMEQESIHKNGTSDNCRCPISSLLPCQKWRVEYSESLLNFVLFRGKKNSKEMLFSVYYVSAHMNILASNRKSMIQNLKEKTSYDMWNYAPLV